jgi:hypothetical protein
MQSQSNVCPRPARALKDNHRSTDKKGICQWEMLTLQNDSYDQEYGHHQNYTVCPRLTPALKDHGQLQRHGQQSKCQLVNKEINWHHQKSALDTTNADPYPYIWTSVL